MLNLALVFAPAHWAPRSVWISGAVYTLLVLGAFGVVPLWGAS